MCSNWLSHSCHWLPYAHVFAQISMSCMFRSWPCISIYVAITAVHNHLCFDEIRADCEATHAKAPEMHARYLTAACTGYNDPGKKQCCYMMRCVYCMHVLCILCMHVLRILCWVVLYHILHAIIDRAWSCIRHSCNQSHTSAAFVDKHLFENVAFWALKM